MDFMLSRNKGILDPSSSSSSPSSSYSSSYFQDYSNAPKTWFSKDQNIEIYLLTRITHLMVATQQPLQQGWFMHYILLFLLEWKWIACLYFWIWAPMVLNWSSKVYIWRVRGYLASHPLVIFIEDKSSSSYKNFYLWSLRRP